ncbi:hypothetical protein GCM10010345_59350 [Streptomyces canarius]|uniref:Uncharacterized protein n=1 Tax=Streptomyces canarius TaxID=285453 RepID=A0ABQ3CWL8_9ACTN|nr:hypothetical protein GCM10010345_59350 [Streptomyces canarius]
MTEAAVASALTMASTTMRCLMPVPSFLCRRSARGSPPSATIPERSGRTRSVHHPGAEWPTRPEPRGDLRVGGVSPGEPVLETSSGAVPRQPAGTFENAAWTWYRRLRWYGILTCARTGRGSHRNGAEVSLVGGTSSARPPASAAISATPVYATTDPWYEDGTASRQRWPPVPRHLETPPPVRLPAPEAAF